MINLHAMQGHFARNCDSALIRPRRGGFRGGFRGGRGGGRGAFRGGFAGANRVVCYNCGGKS